MTMQEFRQFPLATFQHRVDSAIRYLPSVAWIILREYFHPRGLFHQIKLNFSPFTVVVYLIGVDSGGDFFAFTLDGFLLEPHAMELAKLNKLKRQLFDRTLISTLRAGCTAALKQRGQCFKGCLRTHTADATTVHANGVALLQQGLVAIRELPEGLIHLFRFHACP